MNRAVQVDLGVGLGLGRKARALGRLIVLLHLAAMSTPSAARSTCTVLRPSLPALAATIGIVGSDVLPPRVLERAIALWSRCANYGTGFPAFVVGPGGDQRLSVQYLPGEVGRNKCGSFAGREIRLYRFAALPSGRIEDCGSIELNLAHELGHALGLGDAVDGRACQVHVMAGISSLNEFSRRVTVEECQVVGQRWLTPIEMSTVTEDRQADLTGFVVGGGR